MANIDRERQKMHHQKERLAFDTKELISSAEEMLRSTASYTGAEIDEARRRLKQQLESARDRGEAWRGNVRDTYQSAATATEECVRERPWTFIGTAFVLGMGLAHCLRRDRDHR